MNKHLKNGLAIGFLLLLSLVIITYADPPNPPITVKGFVFGLTNAQLGSGINVSVNNTNTSDILYGTTSGPTASTTGFYHLDVNGSNGDLIRIYAWNSTNFGYNTSVAVNNTVKLNITFNETRPSAPILLIPANQSLVTTRSPSFTWNNSYDQINNTGMVRNYTLQITNDSSFAIIQFNISNISETNAVNTTYNLSFDLSPGTYYWRVQAFQKNTSSFSSFSDIFNFTVATVSACTLPTSIVDFGILGLNRSNNTLQPLNNPRPIEIRNTGNVIVNVSINATNLWNDSSAQNPSRFYQWKITDNATNSFESANTTIFLNMSTVAQRTITTLRYANGSFPQPAARVELNITAPAQEPPGLKRSDILLVCTG